MMCSTPLTIINTQNGSRMGYERTQKGEISIGNHNGRIRLRWRYGGHRYSLNLPFPYSPENMKYARLKVSELKVDMLKDCFDTSLEKYRPKADTPIVTQSLTYLDELCPKFREWCRNIRNVDMEASHDYRSTYRLLDSWTGISIAGTPEMLNQKKWAVITYNRRLNFLSTFFTWLVDTGLLPSNPLVDIRRRKGKGKKGKRKPLSPSEITALLEAVRNNTYLPKCSAFQHSHYYPLLLFIFTTGVRNAEAIGLRVKHINISGKQARVEEAFARTIRGSNHSARIQKPTKTGNTRYIPIPDELLMVLIKQIEGKKPDDFVFHSPKGLSIDDKMLQKRILKPVMKKLGIEDRDLYAARHSFGTRAVQQGIPLTDVAYLMGHASVETTSRNYVHVESPAVRMPEMKEQ